MPFITKPEADARAAAKAAAADAVAKDASLASERTPALAEPDSNRKARRRGHAVKGEDGNWQATGDYEEGWCRPPKRTRFQDGCEPGPGRPKSSISYDSQLKKHLGQKRELTLNGKKQTMTTREIILVSTIKAALGGQDRDARKYVLAQIERLFPSRDEKDGAGPGELSDTGRQIIEWFEEEIKAQGRNQEQGL